MKSTQAQAAKLIRQELKASFPNTKFKVRSEPGSIDVKWVDGPSESKVDDITSKYIYGKFNGMIDMYEFTNSNPDLPQVRFIFLDKEYVQQEFNQLEVIG